MLSKEYKNYRTLLGVLRGRGMVIEKGSQGSRVIRILKKENYYKIINGYKELFLAPDSTAENECYKPGTTFDEVYALYEFDREIRHIYLKYLLKIESSFKAVLSHEFSRLYGHDNYLKLENFNTRPSSNAKELERIARQNRLDIEKDRTKAEQLSAQDNIQSIIKLIGDIQQEVARQMGKGHEMVNHYMSEYGYMPLWVMVNVLSFGKVTLFYKLMKPEDRVIVAKIFGIHVKELHKYMHMCGLARNKCAHDERFFDIRFRKSLHTKSISDIDVLGLLRNASGSYIQGTSDAYAIAIIFARLLSNSDVKSFVSSMRAAFSKLAKQLCVISVEDVMGVMGYSCKWDNLLKLKK